MGCTASSFAVGRRKTKPIVPEVVVYAPSMRIPCQTDLQRTLRGLVPRDLIDRLACLRTQIVMVAEDTGGTAATELTRASEQYLSLLIGLSKKEIGIEGLVEFKWKNLGDARSKETSVANIWFEVLSVIHMMAILTLFEANALLIPKDHSGSGVRILSSDCKRDAVDLLLKASGYLEFCIRQVLVRIPSNIKERLPKDLQEGVLEAILIQALGQGTEIQLGLAVESQNATLSVKRRLACEQMIYFSQAYHCLSGYEGNHEWGKKHLWFTKQKFLEAKAAAYYYHGLILDKGSEPASHVSAVCCFLAAEELLSESKKAGLSFCLAAPVTRSPPPWGAMKQLHQKIPEVASRKSQMYGYLLEEEKALQALPDLPEFQLSLRPDDYVFPEIDPAWNSGKWEIQSQSLKEHLIDSEEETEAQ
ncbi:hypothetical protein K2173_027153 [Erythroxylum novogranatense]|uniref:BRO1 domain-containing protein n=1 Tax=Erythroxylum novogranatense TaxID=1862640 RepID=A0AAV8TZM7_9ROSI|nr:hypothetical protein K2173_027153 [Erythroxylum novogranatense]